jgi:hypothetical protein
VTVSGPEFDLVPESVFKAHSNGKTFADINKSPVTIDRPSGGTART